MLRQSCLLWLLTLRIYVVEHITSLEVIGFWTFSIVVILKNTTFRKLCFHPQVKGRGERVNLNHWTTYVTGWLRLAISNGPNRLGVSCPLTWRRKQIQFPKHRVIWRTGWWIKFNNSVIRSGIHQSQNPLESKYCHALMVHWSGIYVVLLTFCGRYVVNGW
jgi:hypothetical protein